MSIKVERKNGGLKEIILIQLEYTDYEFEDDALLFLDQKLLIAEQKMKGMGFYLRYNLQQNKYSFSNTTVKNRITRRAKPGATPRRNRMSRTSVNHAINNTQTLVSVLKRTINSNNVISLKIIENLFSSWGICPLWPFC